ncbi:hypothetical protein HYS31_04235 [Candidatus Woesearchaeota archaeon]|nr:hypothetical protein [Candidatus Woesearchaeota archaeon]
MKKIALPIMAFLLVVNAAFAADFANYPGIFTDYGNFDAVIVVGDSAPASDVIAQSSLVQFFVGYLGKPIVGSAKLSSEIDTLEQNIISVGSPCHNPVSAQIMGNPEPCSKNLEPGKAVIALYDYKSYSHLVIAGYSDKGTRDAANELVNKWKSFSGNKLIIEVDEPKPQIGSSGSEEKTAEDYTAIDIKEESVAINLEDEKEKLVAELNEKIANKSKNTNEKTALSINETKKTALQKNDAIKAEQKQQAEEKSIMKKVIEWLSSLFGRH